MASDAPKGRHPIRESAILGWYILRNWFLPGGKGMVPYSIQWLMWVKPAWFRQDLVALLELLQQNKIKPLIAERLPLGQARRAQELLGRGGVIDRADTERVTGLQFARLIVRRWEAAAVCILLPHLRIGILARIPNRSVFGMHLLSSNATKRAPKAYYWQTSSILLPRTGGACA